MKRLLAALALALCSVAHGAVIETTFTGTVTVSEDHSNRLGYGSAGPNGSQITLIFRWSTSNAPSDFYGGARFPVEADYTNTSLPVWISATVIFDNGFSMSSSSFDGTGGIQQQVKIQDDCNGCSFDPIGGTAWDSYGNFIQIATQGSSSFDTFIAGGRVFDYTEAMLDSIELNQLVKWKAKSSTDYGDAQFSFRHVDLQNSANSYNVEIWGVSLESLKSHYVPEPSTLALIGVGLAGIAALRRREDSISLRR